MPSAFQSSAFQSDAFQTSGSGVLTGLTRLQLPVDYYMEGLPQYRAKGRTFEPGRGKAGEDVTVTRSRRGRIKGPAPSFTTTTNKRGYD